MNRRTLLTGTAVAAAAVFALSFSIIAGASDRDAEPGVPPGLPAASSLKACAGLSVTIVVEDGQKVEGTPGNDVVALDPKGSYSPNGGTDIICDGSGQVQTISYPEGSKVPQSQDEIDQTIRDLGGAT